LSTQAAVWVLVEHIKNSALSFEQLAARLQEQRQLRVRPEAIGQFFQEQGLKKTPEASS
jgi:transposase